MKTNKPHFEIYQNLLRIYQVCLKNKPNIKKSAFHLYHESELFKLARSIHNRTYCPAKSSIFVVTHPKPREIIAAHIRDRVVHHFIYDYMNPYWERRFVKNSYACRQGQGPLQASLDLRRFLAKQRCNSKGLYYLKVDIASFFPSINLNILYEIIQRKLTNPLYLWLCQVVIFHRPTKPGRFELKSAREKWEKIPKHKSMFYLPDHKGLPIGNLTSQFFANVYMNEFDQFIAHNFKDQILFWQRYVDDALLISDSKAKLRDLVPRIECFLHEKLDIALNPTKTIIQPLCHGLDHLGFFHKPSHVLVRKSVVYAARKRMNKIANEIDGIKPLQAAANSYLGHFSNGDSYKLRKKVISQILAGEEQKKHFCSSDNYSKLTAKRDTDALSKAASDERELIQQFETNFIDHKSFRRRGLYVKHWKPVGDILTWSDELLGWT